MGTGWGQPGSVSLSPKSCVASAFRLERVQEIQYRADAAICNMCQVKEQCTESPRGRHVHRSFFADYMERVKGYQQTLVYQRALNKRKVWVEPLFAKGKQWYGMGRFRLQRLWRVNCETLMIASGQNLKRLLQKRGWERRPFPTEAAALALPVNWQPEPSRRHNRWKSDWPSIALITPGTRRHVEGAEDEVRVV
jgi:Transposase DDE domain